jgi:hypothetical protein
MPAAIGFNKYNYFIVGAPKSMEVAKAAFYLQKQDFICNVNKVDNFVRVNETK